MSKRKNTKIYQEALKLAGMLASNTGNLPKGIQGSLWGGQVLGSIIFCLEKIRLAEASAINSEKISLLMSLMFDTEKVRIRLQICLESKLISKSLYEKYIGHLESIENQATNWIGYMQKKEGQ